MKLFISLTLTTMMISCGDQSKNTEAPSDDSKYSIGSNVFLTYTPSAEVMAGCEKLGIINKSFDHLTPFEVRLITGVGEYKGISCYQALSYRAKPENESVIFDEAKLDTLALDQLAK